MCVAPRSVPLSQLFVVLRASPSTPGVSVHLQPCIVALSKELDHSKAGEHEGKELCVCVCALFVGEVPLEAELMSIRLPSMNYLPPCDVTVCMSSTQAPYFDSSINCNNNFIM